MYLSQYEHYAVTKLQHSCNDSQVEISIKFCKEKKIKYSKMFCALCLEKSKELKTIDQQHRDTLAKSSIAITSNGQQQWICRMCEEDIKMRQNNPVMQSESKQLNEFLSELKENICQSPTKSSINMLLMQTEDTKQLNEMQGNLCKIPRNYVAADGNHDEELKIEKIEIDDTEEFILKQEQQQCLDFETNSEQVQENPNGHIICKKLYTIADDDCAAMKTEDVPSQEIIEKEEFSFSKYTFSDQPLKLSAFGAKFSSDTAATENEFEDNADGLMPSPSAVYSNVERNTMLPSSFTANSNELQNCAILQTKSIHYMCNYCNDNFVNKWSVGRHCKSVHKKEHSDPISYRIPKPEELKEPPQFNFDNWIKRINNFYVCTKCSQQYTSSGTLRNHIKSKHYGYRYFCNYCDAQCTQKIHLQTHCRVVHKKEHIGPLIFRIPKPEELKKPPQFSFDNKIKRINNFYVCTECSKKYQKQQALRDHIKTKHYGYRYFCNYCDAQSTQKVHLQTHCRGVHKKEHIGPLIFRMPKPEELKEPPQFNFDNWIRRINDFYVCTKCSQQYKSSGPLHNHIKSQHYGYRYFCNYCDAQCTHKTHLQAHCRVVHKKEHIGPLIFRIPKPEELKKLPQFSFDNEIKKINNFYVCTVCSQKYQKQQALRAHIKSKHYGYRYFCHYCDMHCAQKAVVERHCQRAHKKEHSDPIIFRIPKSEELKEPEEINYDNAWKKINNNYVCSLCPTESAKKATTTTNLRLHIKIHHYNYRYYCSECDATYLTSAALKIHYKKQHNISDGIIKCQKPQSTDTPIALRTKTYKPMKHYDYTNKYKKVDNHFICTVCKNSKKKYTDAPHIRQHIKFDHYGYRYVCRKCNMSWYGIDGIKSHNLKVHNVKDGPLIFARTKQPRRYTKTKIDFSNTYKKNAEKSYHCLL